MIGFCFTAAHMPICAYEAVIDGIVSVPLGRASFQAGQTLAGVA